MNATLTSPGPIDLLCGGMNSLTIAAGGLVTLGGYYPGYGLVTVTAPAIAEAGWLWASACVLSATNGSIALNNYQNLIGKVTIGAAQNATITNNESIILGPSTVNNNLSVSAQDGDLNITQTGPLTVGGVASFLGETVTLNNSANRFGTLKIIAAANAASAVNNGPLILGTSLGGTSLTVTATGNITMTGTIAGDQPGGVTVTSPGTITADASIGGASITLTGSNIDLAGGSLSPAGAVNLMGPISVTQPTEIMIPGLLDPTVANFHGSLTGAGGSLFVTCPATLYSSSLNVANSQFQFMDAFTVSGNELDITGWNGNPYTIVSGNTGGDGPVDLTPAQLAKVRFINPAGFAPGIYRGVQIPGGEYELVPTPHATINETNTGKGMVLSWGDTSILQSSTNAPGPYTDAPSAASPYTNLFTNAPAMFFRLR